MLDSLIKKEPTYYYQIKNNTGTALQLQIAPTGNGAILVGSGSITQSIEPGTTQEVWRATGSDDSFVFDHEKNSTELYEFKILSMLNKEYTAKSVSFLNYTSRWNYKKINNYEASYTLTVEYSDLQ